MQNNVRLVEPISRVKLKTKRRLNLGSDSFKALNLSALQNLRPWITLTPWHFKIQHSERGPIDLGASDDSDDSVVQPDEYREGSFKNRATVQSVEQDQLDKWGDCSGLYVAGFDRGGWEECEKVWVGCLMLRVIGIEWIVKNG